MRGRDRVCIDDEDDDMQTMIAVRFKVSELSLQPLFHVVSRLLLYH